MYCRDISSSYVYVLANTFETRNLRLIIGDVCPCILFSTSSVLVYTVLNVELDRNPVLAMCVHSLVYMWVGINKEKNYKVVLQIDPIHANRRMYSSIATAASSSTVVVAASSWCAEGSAAAVPTTVGSVLRKAILWRSAITAEAAVASIAAIVVAATTLVVAALVIAASATLVAVAATVAAATTAIATIPASRSPTVASLVGRITVPTVRTRPVAVSVRRPAESAAAPRASSATLRRRREVVVLVPSAAEPLLSAPAPPLSLEGRGEATAITAAVTVWRELLRVRLVSAAVLPVAAVSAVLEVAALAPPAVAPVAPVATTSTTLASPAGVLEIC